MKALTYINLKNELKNHDYGFYGKYTIEHLFKVYTTTEITNYGDFFNISKTDFREFVEENIGDFAGITRDSNGKISNEDFRVVKQLAQQISAYLGVINSKHMDYYRRGQEDYVRLVEHYLGNYKPNTLEVGSGKIPYSSILLARILGGITSMDKFVVSDETLRSIDINPEDSYFKAGTDVSEYDFVTGNKPCSAIEPIVSSCVVAKKPYIIKLCPCDAPNQKLENWPRILKKYDKHIKFSKHYEIACNLDGNFEDFDRDYEIDFVAK